LNSMDSDNGNGNKLKMPSRGMSRSSSNLVWEGPSQRHILPQEHYMKIAAIGIGAYGKVFKVKNIHTNHVRALKVINKSPELSLTMVEIAEEIKILKNLDHPNIVQVFESFEDDEHFFIVSELCSGGDLLSKLNSMEHMEEYQAKYILKQVLSAVAYIHEKNIIHGDIKLENIMIDDTIENTEMSEMNYEVKLIDFGCSRLFKSNQTKILTDIIGTSLYLAPEVIGGHYDEKCDVWSCGIILYTLVCAEFPFTGKTEGEIFTNIIEGKIKFDNPNFKNVSKECKELILKLLAPDSSKRLSAKLSLHDPWFQNNNEIKQNSSRGEEPQLVKRLTKNLFESLKNIKRDYKFQHLVKNYFTHNFTDKESLKSLRDIFKYIDADEDGKISKKDLETYYKSDIETQQTPEIMDKEIERVMQALDFESHGYIEYEEFIEATLDLSQIINNKNIETTYKIIDSDNTEYIFPDEIVSYFTIGKETNEKQRKEYKDEFGIPSDESIDIEKFKSQIKMLVLK